MCTYVLMFTGFNACTHDIMVFGEMKGKLLQKIYFLKNV